MVVPIILGAVAETPGIAYQSLREILKPYAKDYALTDSILQEGRDIAKDVLFGLAEENVQYAEGLQAELRASGHDVKLLFWDRKQTIGQVGAVVLSEEMAQLKKLKTMMDLEQQKRYVKRWKKDNEIFLNNVFGLADLSHLKHFSRVFSLRHPAVSTLLLYYRMCFKLMVRIRTLGSSPCSLCMGPMQRGTCLHLRLDYCLETKIKQTGPNSGHLSREFIHSSMLCQRLS